jgi:hypothetical protein
VTRTVVLTRLHQRVLHAQLFALCTVADMCCCAWAVLCCALQRRRLNWKQAERDALKRQLMGLGLGRWKEVCHPQHC